MQVDSVISLIDNILAEAVTLRASDVHCEPYEYGMRVRLRIDGVLHDKMLVEPAIMLQALSRIKVLANIDIADRRVPHDGKFSFVIGGRTIDARVSTFPSLYGEKIVVRILDRSENMIDLEHLGLSISMLQQFKRLLAKSNGFFLVSGPTGSGKTTTLYAALSALHAPEKNIVTLEDPVEYYLDGITQGQINPEAGFTFARGLRSLLRQDPDVVMVGEIRDCETAQVAIEAALTGHVVLSTVHTNDAPTVLMRLIDMGIEPFLVNAAICGVLAQRLARTICPSCRERVEPSEDEAIVLERLGCVDLPVYRGIGCQECEQLGYKGRTGIFELLVMTPALRMLIMQRPHLDVIVEQVLKDGMQPMLSDGLQKVSEGIITLDELIRVAI